MYVMLEVISERHVTRHLGTLYTACFLKNTKYVITKYLKEKEFFKDIFVCILQ